MQGFLQFRHLILMLHDFLPFGSSLCPIGSYSTPSLRRVSTGIAFCWSMTTGGTMTVLFVTAFTTAALTPFSPFFPVNILLRRSSFRLDDRLVNVLFESRLFVPAHVSTIYRLFVLCGSFHNWLFLPCH